MSRRAAPARQRVPYHGGPTSISGWTTPSAATPKRVGVGGAWPRAIRVPPFIDADGARGPAGLGRPRRSGGVAAPAARSTWPAGVAEEAG